MNQKNKPISLIIDIGLVVLVVLTRILSASKYLHKWDSVQFALALHDYDITRHQPHPTGYPGYIGLGWIARLFASDDNSAFVAVGIISGVVIAVGVHHLGRFFLGNRGGFIAGLLATLNPLLWYFSSIALSYITGLAFAVLAVWAAVMATGRMRLLGPLLAGVAATIWLPGGILIFPVIVWSFLRDFHNNKNDEDDSGKVIGLSIITGAVLFLIPVLIAYLPVILDTGGFREYLAQIQSESGKHVLRFNNWMTRPFGEFTENTEAIANLLIHGLGMCRWLLLILLVPVPGEIGCTPKKVTGFLPLAVIAFIALYWGSHLAVRMMGIILFLYSAWNLLPAPTEIHDLNRMWLLFWWIVPGFIFFTLVHVNYVGILIIFLPPLIMMVAWSIERAASFMALQTVREETSDEKENEENEEPVTKPGTQPDIRVGKFVAWVLIILVAMNDVGGFTDKKNHETWFGIISSDRMIESVIDAVHEVPVPLEEVLLLGDSDGYRHWAYYIPEVNTVWIKYLLYFPVREGLGIWISRDRDQSRLFPLITMNESVEDGGIAVISLEGLTGIVVFPDEMLKYEGAGILYPMGIDEEVEDSVPIAYFLETGHAEKILFGGGKWWIE
ncbi:hypothetical protein KAU08_04545 [bacterium]|nr:hypothetical protein [bacterium]